jgi:hypothetical protein
MTESAAISLRDGSLGNFRGKQGIFNVPDELILIQLADHYEGSLFGSMPVPGQTAERRERA